MELWRIFPLWSYLFLTGFPRESSPLSAGITEWEKEEKSRKFITDVYKRQAPGGRVAILTFHSGEDRLVKKSFKNLYKQGEYSEICKDVIRPSAEECARNSRARSTKMRWAVKA